MSKRRRPAEGLIAGLVLALAGCTSLGPAQPGGLQRSVVAPPRPEVMVAIDPASAELRAYYGRIEETRLTRGLLRRDGEGAPSPEALAETWVQVALRDEPVSGGRPRPAPLRRWQDPVRVSMEFGASTPPETRAADRQVVGDLTLRLTEAAGHPVTLVPEGAGGNFHVLVLSENERRGSADRLRALVPGLHESAVRLVTDLPRDIFCVVIAFARGGGATYTEAIAVVRAEHPDLTRLSCYHEEIAQGLGLAADSDAARPSVFNDDQEFALLTAQDLQLLRLHYDPALRPGMTEAQARPLIFSIASRLVPGAS